MVGRRELEAGVKRGFELFVRMKFGPVVGRNRVHGSRLSANQLTGSRIDLGTRAPQEFADHGES